MGEINLDAAARFGARKAKHEYGNPPAPDETGSVSGEERTLKLLGKIRTGIGMVCAVLFPGLGAVFAGNYGAGLLYAVAFAAFISLSFMTSLWFLAGAAVVWLANIIHTEAMLAE